MLFQCSMFGQIPPRRGEEEERAKVFKFAAFSFYSSSPWQCLKSNKMHKDSNFSIWIINWASKGPIATNLLKRKCKSLESAKGKLSNFFHGKRGANSYGTSDQRILISATAVTIFL